MRTTIVTLLLAALALPVPAFADAHVEVSAVFSPDENGLEGQLNVNDATQEQWELLPGIGPSTAKRLVEYREKQKFAAVNQVMRIKGLGKKTFAQIKPYLTLEGKTTLHETAKAKKPSEPEGDATGE
jgi:competence protein ComEA